MKTRNAKARIHIPAWFTDPTRPLPCYCGEPLIPGQPFIMGENDTGKRWFHISCWHMLHDDDDDDDWDDE